MKAIATLCILGALAFQVAFTKDLARYCSPTSVYGGCVYRANPDHPAFGNTFYRADLDHQQGHGATSDLQQNGRDYQPSWPWQQKETGRFYRPYYGRAIDAWDARYNEDDNVFYHSREEPESRFYGPARAYYYDDI